MVINSRPSFSIKALLFARFLLKFTSNGTSMSFQSMANHNCCGRPLTWVQTLSGIKSFLKKTKCAIPITGIVKIILARVTAKDLTVRIFYKFLLYIKPRHNCCPPPSKFHVLEACKKTCFLIGWLRGNPWYSSFDFLEAKHVR